jgi:hypothetical protein
MKKFLVFAISISVMFAISGCTSKSGSPSDVFKKLHSVEKPDDAKKYFTKGTLKAMDELDKLVPPQMAGKKEDKNFHKDDKWEIVKEEIKNDKAVLSVKYLASKDLNKKDQVVPYKFSKEEGEWKLDYEREFAEAVNLMKGMKGMMNQMNDMLKSLKK